MPPAVSSEKPAFTSIIPVAAAPAPVQNPVVIEDERPDDKEPAGYDLSWITGFVGILIGIALFVFFLQVELGEAYVQANEMIAITSLVACFWAFEVLPLPVTSLLPIVLVPFFGIMKSKEIAKSYWSSTHMMFLGAFIVDIAIEHVNLHKRLALKILITAGSGVAVVAFTVMFISFNLSMWCSNTATTLMLVPFATGLLDTAMAQATGLSEAEDRLLKKAKVGVLLAIPYGATSGGIATAMGTAPNGVFLGMPMLDGGVATSHWTMFALPLSVSLIAVVYAVLFFLYLRGAKLNLDMGVLRKDYAALGKMNRDEIVVILVLILQFGGFLIRADIVNNPDITHPHDFQGVDDSTIACGSCILLFMIPSVKRRGESVLTWDVAQKHLPWGVLVLFGGGFAIADGFKASKLTNFIGQKLGEFAQTGSLALTYLIIFCVCFLTEVTSNTATANIILPILGAVALDKVVNPLALMLPATVACSFAFMLPIATPPNAVMFATRRVGIDDFIKAGFFINLGAVIFGSLVVWLMAHLVFDAYGPFPRWACLPDSCLWVLTPEGSEGEACIITEGEFCKLRSGAIVNASQLEVLF